MKTSQLIKFLDKQLHIKEIEDYSLNGLQVQGSSEVFKIGLAVDASLDAIKEAKNRQCQMLIVHHGLFWKDVFPITKALHKRIKLLLNNNINLYAAHLPLDIDERFGNNIELSKKLGLTNLLRFGKDNGVKIGFAGFLEQEKSKDELKKLCQERLGEIKQECLFGKEGIKRIGIISGKGTLSKGFLADVSNRIDCLITGEFSYSDWVYAKDLGLNMLSFGHYSTEEHGLKGLMRFIEQSLEMKCEFIELNYPL
jgi:dinuclear metal center YbgI/SA1388 family protein